MDVEGDATINYRIAGMNIIFRTDASIEIGTGHVMRCLTLAEAMREDGINCQFICREHEGNLLNEIQLRGFKIHTLPVTQQYTKFADQIEKSSSYSSWLGVDWEEDAHQTEAILSKDPVDWLIVDHYALDVDWEQNLRIRCNKIMVIDDLANRTHDCDLLLDQNFGRKPSDYNNLLPKGCTVITGPQYALLRPEFAKMRTDSLARRSIPQLRHLLISLGGIDKDNVTEKVLDALMFSRLPKDCKITVVMGASAPWLKNIYAKSEQLPWLIEVVVNVNNMAMLMASSDLAIGAAGTTSWERCCLGLPAIIIVLASNQKFIAQQLEVCGAVKIANTETLIEDISKELDGMISFTECFSKMSAAAANLTKGNGAATVLDYLVKERM